jgi:catechol 2,3-dioxygenase-like lactoylglutathione lyase family enzyme
MIIGAHVLMYTENAEADRAFFRDILEFPSVDAGHGWLIFSISPAELDCLAKKTPGLLGPGVCIETTF